MELVAGCDDPPHVSSNKFYQVFPVKVWGPIRQPLLTQLEAPHAVLQHDTEEGQQLLFTPLIRMCWDPLHQHGWQIEELPIHEHLTGISDRVELEESGCTEYVLDIMLDDGDLPLFT